MYYDLIIFNFINGYANHSKMVDMVGIFLAEYLPYALGIFLLLFLFWPKRDIIKNRAMVIVAIIAGLIARFGVKTIILLFYGRARPYIALPSAHKLIATIPSDNFQSFPSGHTIFFFALSTVIYQFNKKLGVFFFICSTLIGIARVFAGVHWPSDIIGGLILGVLVGGIMNQVYVKNQDSIDNFIARMFKGIDKVYDRF
jgi:undecaprenyl-diphosphatase